MRPRDVASKWVKLLPWAYDERRTPARSTAEREAVDGDLRASGSCSGCGAPSGFPPAGPCENHATEGARAA